MQENEEKNQGLANTSDKWEVHHFRFRVAEKRGYVRLHI